MKQLKIGIIGLGGISEQHIRAIKKLKNAEITALCTKSKENLNYKCSILGIEHGYTDYIDLLENSGVDAVIVAVPTYLHKRITIAALNMGKHVLCEKPPAMNAEEAQEMLDCAKRNNCVLMYGFMFRFSKKHNIAKELIEQGYIGNIRLIRAETIRRCSFPGGWFGQKNLSGGGPLSSVGVHCLDLIMYLMGDALPIRAYAKSFPRTDNLLEIKDWEKYTAKSKEKCDYDVEELIMSMVSFSNGAELLLVLSDAGHFAGNNKIIEFIGDKGGISTDPEFALHSVLANRLVDVKPIVNCENFDSQQAIDDECANFVNCILNGEKCIAPPESGVTVMKLIDAIYKSAEIGEPVNI